MSEKVSNKKDDYIEQNKDQFPDFYTLIEEQGGFGTFQKMVYVLVVMGMTSAGWMQYNYAYLMLYPKFHCLEKDAQGHFVSIPDDSDFCKPDYFCKEENNATIIWQIATEDHVTLDNWMKQYHMYCLDPQLISFIGTFFFIGFAVTSPVIPPLSDKYGRKWFFFWSMVLNCLCMLATLVLPGGNIHYYYVIIGIQFLFGC